MQFSALSKLKFYLSLALYNLLSPLECRNFRAHIFLNEFYYLFLVFTRQNFPSRVSRRILLKTVFGDFLIRDLCWDLKSASPAFERMDIEELTRRISVSLAQHRHVLFLDVGAQFGKYSITIGNRFRKNAKNISIYAFEPDPENFSLLTKNVKINNLHSITPVHVALSSRKAVQKFYYYPPQKMIVSYPTAKKISIRTEVLDNYMKKFSRLSKTDVFIKLDVEGHEINVLEGSKQLIRNANNTTLLVEDAESVFSPKLTRYLSAHGNGLTKISTYNSFWRLGP